MLRTLLGLALLLEFADPAEAQFIIRNTPRVPGPNLPLPGSPLQPQIVAPPVYSFRGPVAPNPYYFHNFWGFAPIYPWFEPPRRSTVVNTNVWIQPPPPMPEVPLPPSELRARLSLQVPSGAKVWLAGKEMDTAASPLILESPILQDGQRYTFDLRVVWPEGKDMEERQRKVTVDAGETKSLAYFSVKK